MLKLLISQRRLPLITLLLVLSCLVTSIPQLFLPPLYSGITGQFPSLKSIYLITLPVFSHSPEIFINHLTGNLLVIILFGSLIEIILGSSRFSVITLCTFTSTTLLNYLRETGQGRTHGVSGVCFGYIVFFVFFVTIIIENKKYKALKNPIVLLSILLAVFSVFGIPILEVVVFNQRIFQNFGQTIHLLSYGSVIIPLIIWRKEFEANTMTLLSNQRIVRPEKRGNLSRNILFFIFTVNLFATLYVGHQVGMF